MYPTTRAHAPRGYILIAAIIFLGVFVASGTALLSYLTAYSRAERTMVASTQALAIAEGGLDKAVYQLNQNPSYAGETDTALGNGIFTIAVAPIDSQTKRVTVTAYVPDRANPVSTKIIKATIGINNSFISFHYGIQSGNGGFSLENSSKVTGNVFSSGTVKGSGGNYIYGDVVSAGPAGLVYGIHATSSVYAHTIGKTGETTTVDKDAYYTTIVNTTVTGTSHPSSPDQPPSDLPISDAQIEAWKTQAEAGGGVSCPGGADSVYNISSGNVDLGPVKIPCNLTISNTSVVTIHGPIWVLGDIKVQNSSRVKMASELGAQNVAIIADNPNDRINSSTITVANTATFENSGTTGSFVFLISQNRSAEAGGDVPAFSLSNSASALVAYAAHGLIPLANSVSLKEVTAYKIKLQNTANVIYDTGLPSTVFQSGPGASWSFIPGSYAIIR